jgi:hypothetical protein
VEHLRLLGRSNGKYGFKGPEGIVLAADSRVTLMAQGLAPQGGSQTVPEFETELDKAGITRLPVGHFAQSLSSFFMTRWQQSMPSPYAGPDMTFLVAGYNEGEPYGRVYELHIPGRPDPVEKSPGQFGVTWGGQGEFAARILQGYDAALLAIASKELNLTQDQSDQLGAALQLNLAAQIPYQFLPLQDCVDLSIFLIRVTAAIQNWTIGIRGVGGAIDVATVTGTNGFRPLQQKKIRGE